MVHGSPAIAVPLMSLGTSVELFRDPSGGPNRLESGAEGADLAMAQELMDAAIHQLGLPQHGGGIVARVTSTLPVGHGLGSSAALSVALSGSLVRVAGGEPSPALLNNLAHHLERVTHGRPSGIDDTVVSQQEPILFQRGEPARPLRPGVELRLVLASSGHPGSTRDAVAGVNAFRLAHQDDFQRMCETISGLVSRGRTAMESGDLPALGRLMNRNHGILQELDVSTEALDRLVEAARGAGALGAKLTGAGRGGFCVALAPAGGEAALAKALAEAGSPLVVPPMGS